MSLWAHQTFLFPIVNIVSKIISGKSKIWNGLEKNKVHYTI